MPARKKRCEMIAKKTAFISAYLESLGNLRATSEKMGIPYNTCRQWAADPEVTKERDAILAEHNAHLFALARQCLERTVEADAEGSVTASMFLLKAHQPEVFDERVRQARIAAAATVEAAKLSALPAVKEETPDEWQARVKKELADAGDQKRR